MSVNEKINLGYKAWHQHHEKHNEKYNEKHNERHNERHNEKHKEKHNKKGTITYFLLMIKSKKNAHSINSGGFGSSWEGGWKIWSEQAEILEESKGNKDFLKIKWDIGFS